MKASAHNLFGVAALLFAGVAAAQPSQIKRVVVYPDRATVTRKLTVPCGSHAIASFPGVPPAADPQSFRALAGSAVVDGVRWQEQTRKDAYSAKAEALAKTIESLSAELKQSQRHQARFEQASATARGYLMLAQWHLKREISAPKPATSIWKNAIDTAVESELAAASSSTTARIHSRVLRRQLEQARAEHARLVAAAPRREYLVETVLTCPAGKSAAVELSYLVGAASWVPSYEARAQEKSGKVDLKAFATVTQATGEDWQHAELVLSTAVPRQNATPPKIHALRVTSLEQEPPRQVLVDRSEEIQHSAGASASASVATGTRMRAVAQGLSVQLVVPDPADVPGDGTATRVQFAHTSLPADFHFRASPKLAPFVYLVADAVNAAPFPILAGEVDLYRDGSFLARYGTETVASGARFTLSFGVEERLRAKRAVLEEREHSTGIIGNASRRVYWYRFHVANVMGRAVEIELTDHIPVSEMKDVKVTVDPQTSPGYSVDATDGIVRWPLKLATGEERSLDLAFHIDHQR
jgi:uncharacterized protein (TIGR02231 family)